MERRMTTAVAVKQNQISGIEDVTTNVKKTVVVAGPGL
jgi:hypothetical protein